MSPTKRRYNHPAAMDWLHARYSHHYSLPLHTELLRILKAERAALRAAPTIIAKSDTESVPVHRTRQRLRAA